jgi:hypothetical protein
MYMPRCCWRCTNTYQYKLGGKVGRLVGCHKGGVGQVTSSRQGLRSAARWHQHLLFHNITPDAQHPAEPATGDGVGDGKKRTDTSRRRGFCSPGDLGMGPENGKASTDPYTLGHGLLGYLGVVHAAHHNSHRVAGWRAIPGLLVDGSVCTPSRHGPAACSSSGAGLGCLAGLLEVGGWRSTNV